MVIRHSVEKLSAKNSVISEKYMVVYLTRYYLWLSYLFILAPN